MQYLSVVIPTCDRPGELAACLKRLSPDYQGICPDQYEIIVSDDGLRHSAAELCRDLFPWVKHTTGPRCGPGANRNHGARFARGTWIVFIDDDCSPDQSLLREYQSAMKDHTAQELVVLEGPTLRMSEPPSLLWEAPHNSNGGANISANFAITRESFIAVGGFDERFRYAFEDIEFFNRFRHSQGNVIFLPQAIVSHPLRHIPSSRSLAKRWEGKLILSMDQGAPTASLHWRLPWHVFRVIQSRYRGRSISVENAKATASFILEWLYVVAWTPRWVAKWSRQPRSPFWVEHTAKNGAPPKYGF